MHRAKASVVVALIAAMSAFGCAPVSAPSLDAGGEAPPPEDAGVDAGPSTLGPVESCDELDTSACFSNDDCTADRRCEDVGREDLPTPCCVPGERGTLEGGEPCDPESGQLQCASGVCIQDATTSRCSETCLEDSDCPEGMQRCTLFPFGDTDYEWCFPE